MKLNIWIWENQCLWGTKNRAYFAVRVYFNYNCDISLQSGLAKLDFDFTVFNFIFKTSNANLILLSFMTRLSSLWNNHSINIFAHSDSSIHYYKTASIHNLSLVPTVLIISKNTSWKSFVSNGTINTVLCRDMKIK